MAAVITIVTRTQGRPLFLARCLDSVLAQTRRDWRLVLVNDGGSPAEVERVVAARSEALAGRVEVRHREASHGMEAASNAGFAGAQTPWLTLLDDDDTWAAGFLEKVLAVAVRLGPDCAGVVCRSVTIQERLEGDRIIELARSATNGELVAIGLGELAVENRFTNNAFVFRREVYEALGGFDESLRVYGDWDFALRVLLTHDLEVLPEPLAHYHRREGGTAPNSFEAIPNAAERYRARLLNLWLRGERGRSSSVGALIAHGPSQREQRALMLRIDKYLNALHRVRSAPGLKQLERLLLGE